MEFALDARRDIFSLISARPGIHFREVQRELDMEALNHMYNLAWLRDVEEGGE